MNNNDANASQFVRSIVVVGGGTAGWITAGRIAAAHAVDSDNPVNVTLIESPDVKIIGVGEGTWPTMRATLANLGISETEFIRECDATFKQGAKFASWLHGGDEYYYHPLMIPQDFGKVDLASYWCDDDSDELGSFSNAVCFQEQLCEAGRAPKNIVNKEYDAVANYAYHLNAGKLADFLHKHCVEKLGVNYISDNVVGVNAREDGDIESLNTQNHGKVSGDLFVDCTGFRSLLLGEHYQVPFNDCSDVLFIDNALALQIPYESETSPIACHTISTAQEAGWIWDIGLSERRGVGYVFAEKYSSVERATEVLRQYVGPKFDHLEPRNIKIRSGHRETFWHKNCVAVGLSAGFLEPLEASAIVLVELSATMLAEQLPATRQTMDIAAKRFNDTFSYRWQRIIDFLKLHYVLSKRPEPFWRDNCKEETIPESLRELLALWQYRPPGNDDFTSTNEVFPAASYQYVLYGMGYKTQMSAAQNRVQDWQSAKASFAKNQQIIDQACKVMPVHRELINKIHEFGFQAI